MKNKKTGLSHAIAGNRLVSLAVVVVIFSAAGAFFLRSSFAASNYVSSGVVTDQNNKPVQGVVFQDCHNNLRTTNASGYYQYAYNQWQQYCIRVKSLPQYVSRPVATNRRPEQTNNDSYEWQIAGANCYHNTTYCGPNGISVKTDIRVTYMDLSPENAFNFKVTYSPPAPPAGGGGGGGSGGGSTGGGGTSSGGGSTSSGGGSTSTGTRSTGGGSGGGQTAAAPDTTAPSTPGNVSAVSDDTNKTVKLTWDASTDNVSVAGYSIDRSSDQQTWDSVAGQVTDTNFEDNTVSFGATLYYRVRAFDSAGNTSEYSTAQVTTSDFSANAHADQDSTIDSEDGVVTINIPSGAVTEDVFCSVQIVNNVLSPDVEGYQLASGPYEITCRKKDGTALTSYGQSLSATIHLGTSQLKKAGTLVYFGQKDTDWDRLTVTSHDKKAKTDSVDLTDHQIFTIMKQHKKKSVWLVLFQIFLILGLIVAAIIAFLRFRRRRQLQGQYDDYLHKSRGY